MERCIAIRRGAISRIVFTRKEGDAAEFARRPNKILTALIVKGIALDVPLWDELRSP
jgi:hypothetical protein